MSSRRRRVTPTVTVAVAAAECLITLVSDSCTIRYAVSETAASIPGAGSRPAELDLEPGGPDVLDQGRQVVETLRRRPGPVLALLAETRVYFAHFLGEELG